MFFLTCIVIVVMVVLTLALQKLLEWSVKDE